MQRFKNKVAWITGASSGIGEALAYKLNEAGAHLVISSRNIAELERVKNNCKNKECTIFILPLDLEKFEEMEMKVNQVIEKFGKIDYLFNNGGISQRSFVADTDFSVYQKLMNVNYFGTVALTKVVLPHMIKQNSGHIIVTTSLMGKIGSSLRSGYCASKHALHGFFDSLRNEVWRNNIQVLLVVPGFIKTNISINALTKNGTPQNKMDTGQEKGMTADELAVKILKAIVKNKEELVAGGREAFLGVYMKRFFPKKLSNLLKKRIDN